MNADNEAMQWIDEQIKISSERGIPHVPVYEEIRTALLQSSKVNVLVDSVLDVINDCKHYMPAPPWEITYKLDRAISKFHTTEKK